MSDFLHKLNSLPSATMSTPVLEVEPHCDKDGLNAPADVAFLTTFVLSPPVLSLLPYL